MKQYFKIFILDYQAVETFSGYSDGYGKEHIYNPVLIGVSDYDLNRRFDTIGEAEYALKQHGKEWTEYVIQTIYKIES